MAWADSSEPGLFLEVVGHEVAAVVVTEREAADGVGTEVSELLSDSHAKRLRCSEAGAALRYAPAEQISGPVFGDAKSIYFMLDIKVPVSPGQMGVQRNQVALLWRGVRSTPREFS